MHVFFGDPPSSSRAGGLLPGGFVAAPYASWGAGRYINTATTLGGRLLGALEEPPLLLLLLGAGVAVAVIVSYDG